MSEFMKYKKILICVIIQITILVSLYPCTIGIFRSDLTSDGKPIIWKSRDSGFSYNYPIFLQNGLYPYVGVASSSNISNIWMGVNSTGFAILNSLSLDLPGNASFENGLLMSYSLANFSSLRAFEDYLTVTNDTGRGTKGNFAVIDSFGNGAIYEISNHTWTKFDVNDIEHAPDGFIVRTNFSITGGSSNGIERYNRAYHVSQEMVNSNNVSVTSVINMLIRDFSKNPHQSYEIPYNSYTYNHFGYIDISKSICNESTTNAAVITGINHNNDIPVMWTMTGFPAVSPAIPYLPKNFIPSSYNFSALSQEIRNIIMNISSHPSLLNSHTFFRDDYLGIWDIIHSFESVIKENFQYLYNNIESLDYSVWISGIYNQAFYTMSDIKHYLETNVHLEDMTIPVQKNLIEIYPNPARNVFNVKIADDFEDKVSVKLYNSKGQLVLNTNASIRNNKSITLNQNSNLASGIYFLKISDQYKTASSKLLIIK